MAAGLNPDIVAVRVRAQGDGPLQIELEMPSGAKHTGALDLPPLRARLQELDSLHPVWYTGDPEAYGRLLFSALFPEPLSFHYGTAFSQAGDRGIALRLDFDPAIPELHLIPWERLYQPAGEGWLPMAALPNIFCSRFLESGAPWPLPPEQGPLRALIVVSSPYPHDSNGAQLYVDKALELAHITPILDEHPNQIDYHVLDAPATLDNILAALADGEGYDLLHYIGHGEWDAETQVASLILENPTPEGVRPEGVSAAIILDRLRLQQPLPRLILLYACESAQQSTGKALVGFGPQLIAAGCEAVVCMQEPVEMEIARRFGRRFYGELLEHGIVDQAVNRARSALYDPRSWQWAAPVLFMRLEQGQLFTPEARVRRRVPYKFLAPYARGDADLFNGRSELIDKVLGRIQDYQITVVHGDAGVGLTSLLEAGVQPRLEAQDDLVVRVSEYENLASEVRMRARLNGKPLRLRLSGDAALPEVLRSLSGHTAHDLVLMLDQFERVFELAEAQQQAIAQALIAGMEALGARLKLLIAIHTGYLGDFAAMQERFETMTQPWLKTSVLDRKHATEAIVEPLRTLQWPVHLQPDFARTEIVANLDQLYEPEQAQEGGSIDPGQLQIVCYWLYEAARDRDPPDIDEELYVKEAGGAEGILTRYMRKTLAEQLADEQALAQKILADMAAPEAELRVTAADFEIEGASRQRIGDVLERLARADLLKRRRREGKVAYEFANVIVAQEARNLGGEALRRRYQAGDELERIWRMWVAAVAEEQAPASPAEQALPTRGQVQFLAEAGASLQPTPVKTLVVLRAAVMHHLIDMRPWLRWLGTSDSRELMRRLETNAPPDSEPPCTVMEIDRASRLLGLYALPERTTELGPWGEDSVLARAAVIHPQRAARQTAALALAASRPDPHDSLTRLGNALEQETAGIQHWRRQSELFGLLADADPDLAQALPPLSAAGRFGVWGARVWRRMLFDRRRLGGLVWGAALGAGFLLAALRALISLPTTVPPGAIFGIFLFYGGVLGAAVAFGLLLADYMMFLRPAAGRPDHEPSASRRFIVSVLSGALAFALAHTVLFILNGHKLSLSWPLIPLGFVAGLGLSASLYRLPAAGLRQNIGRWLLRLSVSALGFVIVQALLNRAANRWISALAIGWGQDFYGSEFYVEGREASAYAAMALADAALVGVVLTLGVAAGLAIANRRR